MNPQQTTEASMTEGKHDINKAIESDQHPGIIIHDSEGYQAGSDEEVKLFEEFLKKRCGDAQLEAKESLHAVWYVYCQAMIHRCADEGLSLIRLCLETNTQRPVQRSVANILDVIHATDPKMPIILVGTKKDEYIDIKRFREGGLTDERLMAECEVSFEKAFRTHKTTKEIWPRLNTQFAFVSRGRVKTSCCWNFPLTDKLNLQTTLRP